MLYTLKKGIKILDSFIAELHKGRVETPFQASRIKMRNGAHRQIRFLLLLLSIINSFLHPLIRMHLGLIWTPFPIP